MGVWSVPGPSLGHSRAQLCQQPGHLGHRGAGSRRGYKALAIKFKLHIRQRSQEQTPDSSCLFLDWKSLFLLAQVVRLEHTEHQQPHGHPQRGSTHSPPSTFHHPLPLSRWKSIQVICCITAEGTRSSSPDTLVQPRCRVPAHLPHCVDQPRLLSTKSIIPHVCQRSFGNFKGRIQHLENCLCFLLKKKQTPAFLH